MALKPYKPSDVQGEMARNVAVAPPGSRRILYVEDEDVNWDVTYARLSGKFHMERAKTANEAFDMLSSADFDIIMMDIQLGGSTMSGIDITKTLKGTLPPPVHVRPSALKPEIPVIFVTAYQARYTREELIQAGGEGVIYKPVDFTALSLAMARCFSRQIGKAK
jgi:two-component system response regulator HydG